MKHDLPVWSNKLLHHAEQCRKDNPVPERSGLSLPQTMQLHIIKGSLLNRLNTLPASKISAQGKQNRLEYNIVFTSNAAGLAAAKELGLGTNLPFFSLYPEELNNFLQIYPDIKLKHHVHIWSHFLEKLDSQTTMFAEPYPVSVREKYWLHVEGIMCGPQLGRGMEHLWSWDGLRPKLLKKNFQHWAS